jgi:ketosteroid isomerase-like protein
MSAETEIRNALVEWADAEARGDASALEPMLAGEFGAIGPLGFSLSRQEWLDRHTSGDLSYGRFELDGLESRLYGELALATVRQRVEGSYRGRPLPSALRASILLTRRPERWQLAFTQMSFVAGTAGAPPIPGGARLGDDHA